MQRSFEDLNLKKWRQTRDALQAYVTVMTRIRQALSPPEKHWGHANLRPTIIGLTTGMIPALGDADTAAFEIVLDVRSNHININYFDKPAFSVSVHGQSQLALYKALSNALVRHGIEVQVESSNFDDTPYNQYNGDGKYTPTAECSSGHHLRSSPEAIVSIDSALCVRIFSPLTTRVKAL